MENSTKSFDSSLAEQVHRLLPSHEEPRGWGDPLLSTTPTALAVGNLAVRVEALEWAVRELALQIQKPSGQ